MTEPKPYIPTPEELCISGQTGMIAIDPETIKNPELAGAFVTFCGAVEMFQEGNDGAGEGVLKAFSNLEDVSLELVDEHGTNDFGGNSKFVVSDARVIMRNLFNTGNNI